VPESAPLAPERELALICDTASVMVKSSSIPAIAQSEPDQPEQAQRPKVLYVMGAGRSGSTILGVTLGNCADFFYAGELDKWLPRAGVPQLADPERTRFWDTVRAELPGASDLFGGQVRWMERSSALFRIRKWPLRRRLRQRYRRVAEDLYRAVARTAGATYIVDTSHYPLRARELQEARGIDLYLVFLVRDPHSVVASFGRSDVREPTFGSLKTNAYLWLTHIVSLYVFLRQSPDRRMFLRHEDFIADPGGVLRALLDLLGSSAALPDFTTLRTGSPIQGNRLITSDVVTLQSGAASTAGRSRITTLLQLPWAVALSRLPRASVRPGQ
jgi:hypothetical protein